MIIMHVACTPLFFFFFQAEDGIRDLTVTGVQTCALPISSSSMCKTSRQLYSPTFIRSCTVRGRPTDAPLKNAPLSRYFLSKTLSTYNCGRSTTPPATRVYPALAFRMKLGSTLIDLLKSNNPVP